MNKEKHSHGEAIHRRRVLAKERASLEYLKEIITETENAEKRAKELDELLKKNGLDPTQKTLFFLEGAWAKYRAGSINDGKRMSIIDHELNRVKKENPEIYIWLMTRDENGLNVLAKIRDRFFRPQKKRRF